MQWFRNPLFHKKSFEEAGQNYNSAYKALRELTLSGKIEFVLGNCPLEEDPDVEELEIVRHYFKCKCGRIFSTSAYCRGEPYSKICKELPGIDYPVNSDYWKGRTFGSMKEKMIKFVNLDRKP